MPRLKIVVTCLVFILCTRMCLASTPFSKNINHDFFIIISTIDIPDTNFNINLSNSLKLHKRENKRLIAALLSFPVPFGVLGLHRVFLGTRPYMPFAYIGTLGGCFGILPLIDFINILISNKEVYKNFENNPKVFMWVQ